MLVYIDRYAVAHRLPGDLKLALSPSDRRVLFEPASAGDLQFVPRCPPRQGYDATARAFVAWPTVYAYEYGDRRITLHRCASPCCRVVSADTVGRHVRENADDILASLDDEVVVRIEPTTWRWLRSIRDSNDEVCLSRQRRPVSCAR